nr:unnamed protein product [Callosobruchus analis]
MKCHYEVLDVSREATDSEIKTAYRKLALKWHPDKNLDNPDYAKEQFQLVQQAYEVLSDRQERAWYDNHREQILRGSNSEFQDKSLDVFQYFTTTCFKGYGDDESGFYAVYRKVFDQITKEDMEFMEDKEEFCEIPSFGNSTTDYDKVSEFYAYWLNYSTKKSYVWLDPYDITSRDRRYAKLAEKENKKVRLKAKKERNEEIRNLVAFVRKRDKRVQAQKKLQEQKLLEDKKKREELSKQKRRERQQELSKNAHQPEWAKFDNVKSELEKIERSLAEEFSNSDSDEEEQEDDNNLFCVACNKLFKTPKAFENHESSKRHKDNVEVLKQIMAEEDEEIGSSISEDADEYNDVDKNSECLDKLVEDSVEDVISSDEESIESIKKQKKKKKPRKVINIRTSESDHIEDLSKDIQNKADDLEFVKKSKKKNRKGVKETKPKQEPNTDVNGEAGLENINGESFDNDKVPVVKKKSKKDKKNKKESDTIDPIEIDISHTCVTSADRNKTPILEILKKYFKNIEGNVLEISSGTGQHLAHFAPNFPKLTFQPSEFDTSLFPSIKAYAEDVPTRNVKEPVYIDAADDWRNWNVGNNFDYVINVNMIHVSPYSCTVGLFRNVSEILKPGGIMITYGAYANNGIIEPQSNIDFDKEIRRRNKEYGIRDIQDLIKLAKDYGIELTNIHDMPANNKCLVWKKSMTNQSQ